MWHCEVDGVFRSFSPEVSALLAAAFAEDKAGKCRFQRGGWEYEADFAKMVQKNLETAVERPIRRVVGGVVQQEDAGAQQAEAPKEAEASKKVAKVAARPKSKIEARKLDERLLRAAMDGDEAALLAAVAEGYRPNIRPE